MKKFLLLLAVVVSMQVMAQSEKYVGAMKAALEQLKIAKDADAMAASVAKFERIGDAEKTQWLPFYYAAITKARMAFQRMGGDPDKVSDDAATILAKAEVLAPNNSELLCVKSMIASAKMMVDPMNRWQEYGTQSNQYLEQAKKADTSNPRPFVLQAMALKNTPEQYGGGCKRAKPTAEKAVLLYATFKPESELSPIWGKELVDQIVSDCK